MADRAALGLLERLREERIGFRAALVGREIVSLVEVDRIDRLDGDELRDVDRVGAGLLHGLDLRRLEGDVLVLGELVTLHHVVALDDGAVLETDVLLPEARAAPFVQQVEGDRVPRLRRAVELDGYRDEPERDGVRSDRPCGPDCLRGYGSRLSGRRP